jgi:hypothetical protein
MPGDDEFEPGDSDPGAPPIDGPTSDVTVDPIGAPTTTEGRPAGAVDLGTVTDPITEAADALAAGIEECLGTLLVHQRRQMVDLLMAFYKARAGLA